MICVCGGHLKPTLISYVGNSPKPLRCMKCGAVWVSRVVRFYTSPRYRGQGEYFYVDEN
jgi:hypothetical protein